MNTMWSGQAMDLNTAHGSLRELYKTHQKPLSFIGRSNLSLLQPANLRKEKGDLGSPQNTYKRPAQPHTYQRGHLILNTKQALKKWKGVIGGIKWESLWLNPCGKGTDQPKIGQSTCYNGSDMDCPFQGRNVSLTWILAFKQGKRESWLMSNRPGV